MTKVEYRGALTVDEFCGWAPMGRSKFYSEVNDGRIRLRKIGRKSVVTVQDAVDYINSLPTAANASSKFDAKNITRHANTSETSHDHKG